MARKLIFPIKMKLSGDTYTKIEFKKRFILTPRTINKSIHSLLVRPIVHQSKHKQSFVSSDNLPYYNKVTFSKPVLRNEKYYTEYKILKPNNFKYIKKVNWINMGSGSGSGSGSNLSSASCMIFETNFFICGYGLNLI